MSMLPADQLTLNAAVLTQRSLDHLHKVFSAE